MSWYVVKGLHHLGFEDIAAKITAKLAEMVLRSGFREQYNPFTGEGYGAKNFGWSTLVADLLIKSQFSET
jgi:hypothetical protein